MRADLYPLQVLFATLAGWVNRHQQDVVASLVEENRVLKEQLKGKRLRAGYASMHLVVDTPAV